MRGPSLCVLVAVLFTLLHCNVLAYSDADGGVAHHRHRRHRRSHHKRDASTRHDGRGLFEEDRFREVGADSRADSSSSQPHDPTQNDVIQALFQVVERGKRATEKAYQELRDEQADDEALRLDLKRRQEEQIKRTQMLQRVQNCLSQGPDTHKSQQLTQYHDELKQREADLMAAEEDFKARQAAFDAKLKQLAHDGTAAPTPTRDSPPSSATPAPTQSRDDHGDALRFLQVKEPEPEPELEMAQERVPEVATEPAVPADPRDAITVLNMSLLYNFTNSSTAAAADARAPSTKPGRTIRSPMEFLFEQCRQIQDCGACSAHLLCAWCGGKTQRCMPHHVNVQDGEILDGLESGDCDAAHWQSSVSDQLRLLSLNAFGSDPKTERRLHRFHSLAQTILVTKPDVVAFQDAADWLVQQLQGSALNETYRFSTNFGPAHAPGGLYVMSRFPILRTRYYESTAPGQFLPDQRGRVLVTHIELPQQPRPVVVATTALDWRPDQAQSRADALDFVFSLLDRNHTDDVILMGDFAFDVGARPESTRIPAHYVDVWNATQPANRAGFTWNPVTNPLARESDPNTLAARMDRVLLRSSHWLATATELVGCGANVKCTGGRDDAAPADHSSSTYPSNHYGVFVDMSRFSPYC